MPLTAGGDTAALPSYAKPGEETPSLFWANPPPGPPLSPEALKRRHDIIKALMGRREAAAGPLQSGLNKLGDAFATIGLMNQFDRAEAASERAALQAANPSITPTVGSPGASTGATTSAGADPYATAWTDPYAPAANPRSVADVTGLRTAGSWIPGVLGFNGASDGGADADPQSAAADQDGDMMSAPAPYQVASLGAVPPPASAAPGILPAELPPNPPIPTDIAPAPVQTAQLNTLPLPTEKPRPEPTPEFQRTPQAPLKLYEEPVPPRKPDYITRYEAEGYKMLTGPFGTDPRVQAKAKQLIEFGAGQRQADFERATEIYKRDKTQWDAQQSYQREAGSKEITTEAAARKLQQEREESAHFGGGTQAQAFDIIKESHKEVRPLITTQAAIQNALRVIDQSFTGAGAKYKLDAARTLQMLGVRRDPAISPTQQFQAYVASTIGGLRSQVAGPGSQSEKEMAKLETATGDNISLEPSALKAILGSIEQANLISVAEHQQKLATYAGTDVNRLRQAYNLFGLPIWRMLPAKTVADFKEHYKEDPAEALKEIDGDYSTPGLGLEILKRR